MAMSSYYTKGFSRSVKVEAQVASVNRVCKIFFSKSCISVQIICSHVTFQLHCLCASMTMELLVDISAYNIASLIQTQTNHYGYSTVNLFSTTNCSLYFCVKKNRKKNLELADTLIRLNDYILTCKTGDLFSRHPGEV